MKIKFPIIWLLVALIIFIFSFFQDESTLDIHMHDTYFVVAYTHICWFFSFICILFAGLYFVFKNILWSKYLSWFHLLGTILFFIFSNLKPNNTDSINRIPRRYSDFSSLESLYQSLDLYPMMSFIAVFFLLSQLIFCLNLIIGLISKFITHIKH